MIWSPRKYQTRGAADADAGGGAQAPIRIGISTCLLGEPVRYDGGHKRDAFLVATLGRYVEWVPVCPEVEAGFGVPREPMQLRHNVGGVRLVTTSTGIDHTERMRRFAVRRVAALGAHDLSGYVLKSNSPSCGMDRVKIYGRGGSVLAHGHGLFAAALLRAFPHLPIEEEGRLGNPRVREHFIERVFAYRRLRSLFNGRWTIGDLVAFHGAHTLQLMAHAPRRYRQLSRLVAGAKVMPRRALHAAYESEFNGALAVRPTPKRHVNVLRHILGCMHDRLAPASRRAVVHAVERYRRGEVPLAVPLTLVRQYVRQFAIPDLQAQTYLEPHMSLTRGGSLRAQRLRG
jgi:uncharacterized protein YbbK (DUF523 family)/uncharacterized protein YbgA (DUF1722 family)